MSTSTTCKYTLTDSNGTSNEATITVEVTEPPFVGEPTIAELFAQPFNSGSAFNRPIGTGATYSGLPFLGRTDGTINDSTVFSGQAALATASDPSRTFTSWTTAHNNIGMPFTTRIPNGFPSYDSTVSGDRAITVVEEGNGVGHDIYNTRISGSTYQAGLHRTFDLTGLGHGTTAGFANRIGNTASGAPLFAGTFRKFEFETPGLVIRHAHHMVAPRFASHTKPFIINRRIQLPAVCTDGNAGLSNSDAAPCAMGELLAIRPEDLPAVHASIDGMSVTAASKETIKRYATAFTHYGIYIVDGGGQPGFRADGVLNGTMRSAFLSFMRTILWSYLYIVTNSVTGATATINSSNAISGSAGTLTYPAGGGTALAPNAAYDA